jgi:opacity protein-like surface antigen
MRKVVFFFLAVVCLSFSIGASAQSNELAITGGGQFSSNDFFDSKTSWVIGGNFAHRIFSVPFVSLYFEVPVVVAPNSGLKLTSTDYSSVFVTPGVKLKLAPSFPLSPYVAAGVGFAHFRADATATTPSDSHTNAVFDIGGGLDLKIAPFVSLRGEVRDFYSGIPDFNVLGGSLSGRQHNVVPQAGLVFRF